MAFTLGDFYPRPPRGGRPNDYNPNKVSEEFLSTPSARRATEDGRVEEAVLTISIHALREEGDVQTQGVPYRRWLFLSTPSARRATISVGEHQRLVSISIHALREEGDEVYEWSCKALGISIHALREEGDL